MLAVASAITAAERLTVLLLQDERSPPATDHKPNLRQLDSEWNRPWAGRVARWRFPVLRDPRFFSGVIAIGRAVSTAITTPSNDAMPAARGAPRHGVQSNGAQGRTVGRRIPRPLGADTACIGGRCAADLCLCWE